MSALILPSRRVIQPRAPTPVQLSNPFARGLVMYWHAGMIRPYGVGALVTGSEAKKLYYGRGGAGYSAITQATEYANIADFSSNEITLIATFRQNRTSFSDTQGSSIISVHAAGWPHAYPIAILQPSYSNRQVLRAESALPYQPDLVGHDFATAPGEESIVALRRKQSVVTDFWAGGRLVNAGAAQVDGLGSINKQGTIHYAGSRNADSPFADDITYGWWIFNRALSDGEIRELTLNPWQLFQPTQRRIWVGGGGATNYTLTADVGAYTLTGESATTSRGVRMTGDVGSYALTGQAATTSRGYSLTGDVGAYSLTGESAGTQAGFRIGADTGAYSLTGQNATTSKGTRLVADIGTYTLTGQDATLTATATVNYTLTCETGVYSLDGGAATFDFLVEGVQLLGGGPGLPRKKKRVVRTDLDKDSYLYRLLSPELRQEVPPEVAEVIEEQAAQAVEQPKKPAQAKKDLRSALKDEGIAYREAYREALTLAIQEMQRQDDEEEEAIAVALASLI